MRSTSFGDLHPPAAVMGTLPHDCRQLPDLIAAALSAELEWRVPADLVSDIVRTVLDENRSHELEAQPTLIEARQRLGRLIRADSSFRRCAGPR